ncbi:MAG: DUF2851 family protein [Bacteroidia bacterium]|nr:DUF2851 family protein [Bacteroidia bacterium]
MLNEKFLSIIWKYKIFSQYPLKSISGKSIEIIHPGELNNHAGPDFLNARIRIDNIQWAGNIEIHQNTSDFFKHQHHRNKNYQPLVLHVVYEHDIKKQIPYSTEILELKNYISDSAIQQYQHLINSKELPACLNLWSKIDELLIQHWLHRLAIERLEKKYQQLQIYFDKTKDFQETFYRLFSRHLGFHVNNDCFETLAEKLSLKLLLKHANRLDILEALIYGTAGFLNRSYKNQYLISLQNEFEFLKKKYQIEPIETHLWKFSKVRPSNFPSLRLHQLALLVHRVPEMFQDPALFFQNKKYLEKLHLKPQGYFVNHLTFEEDKTTNKIYIFGKSAVHHIIINVITPYLFFYGKNIGDEKYQSLALHYLEDIPAEINHITKKFELQKYHIKSALQSQAALELYANYCKQKRCGECNIGVRILGSKN